MNSFQLLSLNLFPANLLTKRSPTFYELVNLFHVLQGCQVASLVDSKKLPSLPSFTGFRDCPLGFARR